MRWFGCNNEQHFSCYIPLLCLRGWKINTFSIVIVWNSLVCQRWFVCSQSDLVKTFDLRLASEERLNVEKGVFFVVARRNWAIFWVLPWIYIFFWVCFPSWLCTTGVLLCSIFFLIKSHTYEQKISYFLKMQISLFLHWCLTLLALSCSGKRVLMQGRALL